MTIVRYMGAVLAALMLSALVPTMAAEAVKPILDRAEHHKSAALKLWERLVNIDSGTSDETGSLGTRLLIEKLAKEHDVALNLESGRAGDSIVIWRKGSGIIKVEVKGKAAHAGGSPDSGRNAAMELAHQILQLSKLANRE